MAPKVCQAVWLATWVPTPVPAFEQRVVGLGCTRSPPWIRHAYASLESDCSRARRLGGHVHARRDALGSREQSALGGVLGDHTQVAAAACVERRENSAESASAPIGVVPSRTGAAAEAAASVSALIADSAAADPKTASDCTDQVMVALRKIPPTNTCW